MNTEEIISRTGKIKSLVHEMRLRDAYAHLKRLSEQMLEWELTRRVEEQEEAYRYMVDYAARGVEDAARKQLYRNLREEALTIADRLNRKGRLRDGIELYFATLRYEGLRGKETISELVERYKEVCGNDSLLDLIASGDGNGGDKLAAQSKKEALEKRIFDRVWVSFPLASESVDAIRRLIQDSSIGSNFRVVLLWALLLGELEYHDSMRVELMAEAYQSDCNLTTMMMAMVAIAISLNAHRDRELPERTQQIIAGLRETEHFEADLHTLLIELIRTSDTERVSKKLRDEIIPEMMKLRPDISKKLSDHDGQLNIGDLEANPEWAEKFEKSGLEDKLREMTELQEEGSDIMMGAFERLKTYPFFNDVINWMRPFDPDNSHLAGLGENADLANVLMSGNGLCDSDKYSLALSMSAIPESQRAMMERQLREHSDQIAEITMASLNTALTSHKAVVRSLLQSMYRFFNLYRRKGDFKNPFKGDLNLALVPAFGDVLFNESTVRLIGEFYFTRGYWDRALDAFNQLKKFGPLGVDILQKTGYCHQREGRVEEALRHYRLAELIDADNQWTIRRIAACLRLLGKTETALEYLTRLERDNPDDIKLVLNIGHCLLELGRDKEAVEKFYQAEFLDEKSTKPLRPLAWSLLLSRQYDQAKKYYDRILTLHPTPDDYLNMGHLALAGNDFRSAINFYGMYIDLNGADMERFIKAFADDRESLDKMGVDPTLIPLVVDQLEYDRMS